MSYDHIKNSRYNFSYCEEDGDHRDGSVLSLVKSDGTLKDKPEDWDSYNGYGKFNEFGHIITNHIGFALSITENRDGILAEWHEIKHKEKIAADLQAKKHRIGGITIPTKSTILTLGSGTTEFTMYVDFPNGLRCTVEINDDGAAKTFFTRSA